MTPLWDGQPFQVLIIPRSRGRNHTSTKRGENDLFRLADSQGIKPFDDPVHNRRATRPQRAGALRILPCGHGKN